MVYIISEKVYINLLDLFCFFLLLTQYSVQSQWKWVHISLIHNELNVRHMGLGFSFMLFLDVARQRWRSRIALGASEALVARHQTLMLLLPVPTVLACYECVAILNRATATWPPQWVEYIPPSGTWRQE